MRNILTRTAERLAGKIADFLVEDDYEEIVTLDLCLKLAEEERKKFQQIKYFMLSVQENAEPKNENDNFVVMIDFLDFRRRAFVVDGNEDSYTLHTGKVDEKIYTLLNGRDSVIIQV